MTPLWTPGPWAYDVDTERIYPVSDGVERFIAVAEPNSGPLMAMAPEMAEALVQCDELLAAGCEVEHVIVPLVDRLQAMRGRPAEGDD